MPHKCECRRISCLGMHSKWWFSFLVAKVVSGQSAKDWTDYSSVCFWCRRTDVGSLDKHTSIRAYLSIARCYSQWFHGAVGLCQLGWAERRQGVKLHLRARGYLCDDGKFTTHWDTVISVPSLFLSLKLFLVLISRCLGWIASSLRLQ
jgi:hypothetical protein